MAWPFRVTDPLLDVVEILLDANEPLHGWAIMKQTQRTGPTVYQVLERLRKAKWVEWWWEERAASAADDDSRESDEAGGRENVPRRRYYRISGEGAAMAPALLTERGRSRSAPYRRTLPGLVTFLARTRLRFGGV